MDEFDVLYKSKLFRVLHELYIPAWRDIYMPWMLGSVRINICLRL